MYVLGIDPGNFGGFCIFHHDRSIKDPDLIRSMPIYTVDKKKSRKVRKSDLEWGKQKTKTYISHETNLDQNELSMLIKDIVSGYRGEIHCYLEQVHARPDEGVSSSFKFGGGFYAIRQAMVDFALPFTEVTPQAWTKVMHQGTSPGLKAKDRSWIIAHRAYPNINFKDAGNKKLQEGWVDAVLIADWGRYHLNGGK